MTCQQSYAAGAVAALFGFAAVGVVDKVLEVSVGLFWRRYDEQLVEADALMTLGPSLNLISRRRIVVGNGIQHHEVITEAVHLIKSNHRLLPLKQFQSQLILNSFSASYALDVSTVD